MGGGCLIWQPEGSQFPWTPPFRLLIKTDLFCLSPVIITLMKLTCQGLPLQRVDSSAGHGGRECLMRLMGSHNICHTPGQACSAPSAGG